MGRYYLQDESHSYELHPASFRELWRISNIYLKEPGTIDLIRQEVGEGDVFCDIGANTGLYSLMAAMRTGEAGQVYAFEPLAANFASLIETIQLNDLRDRIAPFSIALTDRPGFFPFHYQKTEPGSSGSQLHEAVDYDRTSFTPLVTETKYGTSIDHLIEAGEIRPPTVVKLDVDGNEPRILDGMRCLFSGTERPRILMIETTAQEEGALSLTMEGLGYALTERHNTMGGLRRIREGAASQTIAYNVVFRPQ